MAQPATGPIAGRVIDTNGNGIEGVSVRAMAGSGGPERITAADGGFRFDSLATHEYTVVPAKEGYTFTPSSEWVVIHSDKAEAVEFVGVPTNTERWAILYYYAADIDKDTSDAIAGAMNSLTYRAENPNYAIAALYDGDQEGDARYWMIDDNVSFREMGELNTGDPRTLVDFVDWALGQLDVEHVALVIVGHGNVSGTAQDDSSKVLGIASDTLPLSRDLKNAFQEINARHGKLDVVLLESCLMGTIEVAYQLREYVEYLVASQSLLHVNSGFGPRMRLPSTMYPAIWNPIIWRLTWRRRMARTQTKKKYR